MTTTQITRSEFQQIIDTALGFAEPDLDGLRFDTDAAWTAYCSDPARWHRTDADNPTGDVGFNFMVDAPATPSTTQRAGIRTPSPLHSPQAPDKETPMDNTTLPTFGAPIDDWLAWMADQPRLTDAIDAVTDAGAAGMLLAYLVGMWVADQRAERVAQGMLRPFEEVGR